nr:hypothetical protein CFP56_21607 [Quercus suber]
MPSIQSLCEIQPSSKSLPVTYRNSCAAGQLRTLLSIYQCSTLVWLPESGNRSQGEFTADVLHRLDVGRAERAQRDHDR